MFAVSAKVNFPTTFRRITLTNLLQGRIPEIHLLLEHMYNHLVQLSFVKSKSHDRGCLSRIGYDIIIIWCNITSGGQSCVPQKKKETHHYHLSSVSLGARALVIFGYSRSAREL